MKRSLLELTQNILFAMDSDPVNSISDTIEGMQVANIIQDTYYEILNDRLWPRNKELISLDPSTDKTRPTMMKIPPSVSSIEWIQYNKYRKAKDEGDRNHMTSEIAYMEPEDFLNLHNSRTNKISENVVSFTVNNRVVYVLKNKMPDYWTSFDDEWVIFDSYDEDEEDTLTESRVIAHGYREPVFLMEDTYTPDLPTKAFPYLLSEAKSVAFNQIKQSTNEKEEQRSRRQRRWLAREKFTVGGGIQFTNNYGRHSPKT